MNINTVPKYAAAASVVIASVISLNVSAHGFMDSPKARQAFCQAQGGYWWPQDGSNIPNLACRAAFLESGHVQFIQEHEFAVNTPDYENQAAVEANIPNGTLCAAGSDEKRGMNLPSVHWLRTKVTPNQDGNIKIRYRATTPHNPSFWRFYLTDSTFNSATDTLGWDDLTLVQSHDNVAFVKDADGKRFYEMYVAIPPQFSGDAILYSRWQRNDVVGEGFYNCSDIKIVRDNGEPQVWYSLGFYLRQGQTAVAGDSVQFRLFDELGTEVINTIFAITQANLANWQQQLAEQLTRDYSGLLNIGVSNEHNDIVFDVNNVLSNQVFSKNKEYSFVLSVNSQSENTAPIVNDIDAVVMDENSEVLVHVHSFDEQNDPLTYQFTVPGPLTFRQDGPNITLVAPEVTQDQSVVVSVAVSDGKLTTSKSFNVTIKDTPTSTDPIWQSSVAYNAGDIVLYSGVRYQAKWWVKGEVPNTSNAWQKLASDGNSNWQASVAYQGGSIVTHQGNQYKAKWWTQGDEPGKSNVWQKL